MSMLPPQFPQLIIFDCDGVIIDSEHLAAEVITYSLKDLGVVMSPDECFAEIFGQSLSSIVDKIQKEKRIIIPDEWLLKTREELLRRLPEAPAMEGVYELFDLLEDLNIPFRIASNSSQEEMIIKFRSIGMLEKFSGLFLSARDIGAPKPEPDVFFEAARSANVAPSHCLVLEDSDVGLLAAKRAKMDCILIRRHNMRVPELPYCGHICYLSEFVPLLHRLFLPCQSILL